MPSNGDFGIVIKNKKTEELVLVERGEFQTEVSGAACFKWKCNTEQDTRKLDDGWKEEISHSVFSYQDLTEMENQNRIISIT